MTGKEWLILIAVIAVAVGVGAPLLGRFIRRRDFDAQVSGKKPTRQLGENDRPPADKDQAPQTEYERLKYEAELKSKQNLIGPK